MNYYSVEWTAAFLDKEPESRKEKAINIAKSMGFKIQPLDINSSGTVWEISEDGETLIQPLTSIKGLGDKAIEQIMTHRPFNTVEELLFNDDIVYSKLNKKALDVLVRSGTLNSLIDDRFSGMKHFWSAAVVDRPKKEKQLKENIELYRPEGNFTVQEEIANKSDLTGVFPMDLVLNDYVRKRLEEYHVPPIAEYDPDLQVVWFIPREIIIRKTKNNKEYWIVNVIDSTSNQTSIRCWGVRESDRIHINRPYMCKIDYDEQWGFSSRSVRHNWKLLA